ncbi:Autolysin sensor kinase [Labilithrix luteola]|uniref:Autolysin sensor kinase n=2 Tax=Labilithrix luteola TaxID=1391654 RepID=A0A0K1PK58_9BACT|nr:Autolysin sensor kinase [Labilithrix luteola]
MPGGLDSVTNDAIRRRRWIATSAIVLVVLLVSTVPELLLGRRGTSPRLFYLTTEAPIVIVSLSLHYEWASRRRVSTGRSLATSVAIATILGMAVAASCFLLLRGMHIEFEPERHFSLGRAITFGALSGILQCAVWSLGFVYPFAAEDARLRTLEADKHRLEAEKLKLEAEHLRGAAELANLRSQLEPHFLLNTLNAIAGLVTKHPKEARRLLGNLGDLLRDSLRDPEETQTLADEVRWLHRYAEILESRHSDVLRFHWEFADGARSVLVPRLLLQPLVENAVNHGALKRGSGGEVAVRITVEGSTDGEHAIVCTVEDNGPGLPAGEPRTGAFGLHSVRRRLALRCAGATLQLESTSNGTRATVRLPQQPKKSPRHDVEAA